MDDEMLICLVQSNRELFDKYHPKFKLHEHKKDVWERIATELDSTGQLCARRWLSLRERYAKERRRVDALSASGASEEKVWPLLDSLDFLKDHIIPRPSRTSKNISSAASSSTSPEYPFPSQSQSSPVLQQPLMIRLPSPSPSLEQEDLLSLLPIASPPSSVSQAPSESSTRRGKKRKASKSYNSDGDADTLFRETVEMFKKTCAATEVRAENEIVHSFGQMITASISRMSVVKQTVAMERVTAMVMGMLREKDE